MRADDTAGDGSATENSGRIKQRSRGPVLVWNDESQGEVMKIAATISDAGMALNVGGPVSSVTSIIDIPDSCVPPKVRQFLESKDRPNCYWSLSLTLVDESK